MRGQSWLLPSLVGNWAWKGHVELEVARVDVEGSEEDILEKVGGEGGLRVLCAVHPRPGLSKSILTPIWFPRPGGTFIPYTLQLFHVANPLTVTFSVEKVLI